MYYVDANCALTSIFRSYESGEKRHLLLIVLASIEMLRLCNFFREASPGSIYVTAESVIPLLLHEVYLDTSDTLEYYINDE